MQGLKLIYMHFIIVFAKQRDSENIIKCQELRYPIVDAASERGSYKDIGPKGHLSKR